MTESLSPNLELICDYACETGENPLWHPLEKRLYWTDIPSGRLFRYHPASGLHEQIYQGRPVGGFTFQAGGGLLLFRDRGNIVFWRDGHITEFLPEIPAERHSRFNDVIADPSGRVFCGTMSSDHSQGRLYRLDPDGSLTEIFQEIGCSNGLGFSPGLTTVYYTDSFAHEIYRLDYRAEDGALTNRQLFASVPESFGLPDGLTVDAQGRVWSALWDGSGLLRFDPEGRLEARITLPTRKITSAAFGGNTLSDLYITTAGGNTKDEDGPTAGALYRLKTETRGRPEFFSRITIPSL
jgi:D-xylono/L-arabinono-1,4-lactonase